MKNANITKTIFLIAILALMQIATSAQKAELVVQIGHTNTVESVAFSPDGETLVSSGNDNVIKLWSTKSGQELKTFNGHTNKVSSVAFSLDSKIIVSGGDDNVIKLWNTVTGQEIKTLNGHTNKVKSVAFSPDGKTIASGSDDNTIKLWDVKSGQELKTLMGHKTGVNSVVFAPNGKILASSSGEVKLWDIKSGQELQSLEGLYSVSLAFSHDGKMIALSGYKEIIIWDIANRMVAKHLTKPNSWFFSVAFSPNGAVLASGNSDNTISLWDVESGEQIKSFEGHTASVSTVAFSPDGRMLASGSYDKTIKLWDVFKKQEFKTLAGHTENNASVAFSPDGRTLATGDFNKTIKLWDMESRQGLRTLNGHNSFIESVSFSPDGRILASGSSDKTIKLWNVENGRELRTLTGHNNSVKSIAFSPDGKILVSGGEDFTIKLWDVESGQELKTLAGHISFVTLVAFSLDGKMIVSASRDDGIKLWNATTGQLIKTFPNTDDSTTQELQKSFPNLYNYRASYTFANFGGFQVQRGENGKLNLVEVKSGNLLASLIALDENDWVVIDPDGRFDASPGAEKLMHFVVGLEPVDLEQIKDRYYTPNLLQRIFKGENLDATRKVSVFTADELYPLAEYAPLRANETVVNVKLQNRGGGIGRVQVYVNGAEFLADARPKGFDPKSNFAELKIDFSAAKTLKKGEPNAIKIIARNEAGWLRNRGSEIVYLDERKKDETPQEFYAIIGGVSDYENDAFNLRYSAKDARDFAKAVELGAAKLFGKERVHIRLLASGAETENAGLTGADSKTFPPTKENFRRTFEEFRKAKPTDVFVVYLAGHGTSINKGGDTGDTYLYLTQEAVTTDKSRLLDEKLRGATTVSSEELAEWIRDVPALKRAMILDTCAAGAVEASLVKPRDLSPDQIKALDRMKDRTGFYVLMGSAADAQSYEATRYGQGLLTYSLLQGMSGAKLRGGEYADVSELFSYATDQVTEMAKGIGGIQQPRIIAPTESRPFDIGRFSTVEKSKFTLAKVKPLVLQPQLYNDKLKRDNLKISQTVARILRDESSAASRSGGAETKLVFVEAEEMNDAVTPSGVYEVIGDQIKVTLILVKNNEEVKKLTVEGSAADLEELSRKIVRAIIENAENY